jgi:2-C-methyl-D-erythritol 4-phosphate cytidylyltransferase
MAKSFSAAAIVVAAGSSSRMGGKVRKPYLTLRGKPILAWTLAALAKVKGLKQIVLVTRPDDRAMALSVAKQARLPRRIKLVPADGGARRQDSVLNGLRASAPECDLVLIHDAARPFPPQAAMAEACAKALVGGAAILAVRVKDTVKRESAAAQNGAQIDSTVPRAGLWLAQTPQVFQRRLIISLFEKLAREAPHREVTDDASICEILHQPVALIESSETNFKVTRPEDLQIAEAYLKLKLVGTK